MSSSFFNPSFAFSSHFDPGESAGCAPRPRSSPAAAPDLPCRRFSPLRTRCFLSAGFLVRMEINPFPTLSGAAEARLGPDPRSPRFQRREGLGLAPVQLRPLAVA